MSIRDLELEPELDTFTDDDILNDLEWEYDDDYDVDEEDWEAYDDDPFGPDEDWDIDLIDDEY